MTENQDKKNSKTDSATDKQASTISIHEVGPDAKYRNDASWYPGDVIEGGLFRIVKIIARGGMGIIYKAFDIATNRPVIIKSPRPSMLQDESFKHRFVQEAEEWVKLGKHPHIIRAFAVREIDFLPRVVAEYAEGGALYDVLLDGPPGLAASLKMAIEICWGMAYSHDHDLIHRDLKPGNLLFDGEGRIKITDFGLVKRRGDHEEEAQLQATTRRGGQPLSTVGVVGTPEYISPEQWRGRSEKSSDIYCFGIVLFEIFTSKRPFNHDDIKDENELIRAYQKSHCKVKPPLPSSMHPDVPKEIDELILRCLEKDPKHRPPDFRSLAADLNTISNTLLDADLPPEPAREELDRQSRLDQAWSLLRLGAGCNFRGDMDKAVSLYEEAKKMFDAEGNRGGIGNYYRLMGVTEVARGHNDRAMKFFEASLKIARKTGNRIEESRCYANMGVVYVSRRDYDKGMEMYQHSLDIAEQQDNLAGMRSCANNMGNLYKQSGQYGLALEKFQQSLVFAEALGNRGAMSRCYNNIANVLQLRGDLDRAMEIYQKSLEIAIPLGDRASTSRCYSNIAAIYRKRGEQKKALEMLRKSLDISQDTGNQRGSADTHFTLAQIYRETKYPHMATKHARKALSLMRNIAHPAIQDVETFLQAAKQELHNNSDPET